MCDYSLTFRPNPTCKGRRQTGDDKIQRFYHPWLLAEVGEPNVAVCVRPGTEIAFEK